MKLFIIIFIQIMVSSCVSTDSKKGPGDSVGFDKVMDISPGKDSTEGVHKKLGKPTKTIDSDITTNSIQWNYEKSGYPHASVLFISNVVQSVTWDVRDDEKEQNVKAVLSIIKGKWKLIYEPVKNPHSMPEHCYLIDRKKGKKIEIHAYEKKVNSITLWNPDFEKIQKAKGVPQNYCISGICSKVSKRRAGRIIDVIGLGNLLNSYLGLNVFLRLGLVQTKLVEVPIWSATFLLVPNC